MMMMMIMLFMKGEREHSSMFLQTVLLKMVKGYTIMISTRAFR